LGCGQHGGNIAKAIDWPKAATNGEIDASIRLVIYHDGTNLNPKERTLIVFYEIDNRSGWPYLPSGPKEMRVKDRGKEGISQPLDLGRIAAHKKESRVQILQFEHDFDLPLEITLPRIGSAEGKHLEPWFRVPVSGIMYKLPRSL